MCCPNIRRFSNAVWSSTDQVIYASSFYSASCRILTSKEGILVGQRPSILALW